MAVLFGAAVMAQLKPVTISSALKSQAQPVPVAIDNQIPATQPGNAVVNTKAVLDDIIGASRYDMQTNGTIHNDRLLVWPDGTISATWTRATADPGYSDRGTGYNYHDGSSWGPAPSARIETIRTGWPSVHQWNGDGEMIVSHNSTVNLVFSTRATKGSGAWTESLKPTAPSGVTGLIWPRVITNGANHQNIHIIVVTTPTANGGVAYQGLDGAVIYFRSLDGGATWDKNGIVLPGMESPNYLGFSGDSYAWATPKGDTIAFIIGDDWSDTFLMKSVDNGNTWTKTMIFENDYKLEPSGNETPSFYTCDGAVAAAIDGDGVVHAAFGRMRAKGDLDGRKYYPYTDGLVYWNSTMPAIDSNLLNDLDTLYNHNLLIGYVAANQAGDTIVNFPKYYMSLASFPQIVIDENDNIYFFWSALTVGNPSPDPYNYRHIWARGWSANKTEWEEMFDLNDGVLYLFQEYVYPSTAFHMTNDQIHMITQTSSQPGSNIKDTTIPIHDVNIEYRAVDASRFWPVGTPEGSKTSKNPVGQAYPNPSSGMVWYNVMLDNAAQVTVSVSNIMGQTIMNLDKGTMNAGAHKLGIDASNLAAGTYLCTVVINGESFTRKMIVE
jgi:hypothetical protein